MAYKINVRIAIMSHLSDAEHLVDEMTQTILAKERYSLTKAIHNHISFAKRALLKYDNPSNTEVEEKELDEIWEEVTNK